MSNNESDELPRGSIDPAKDFYLALCAGPQDGVHGVDWDGNAGFVSEKLALECLRNDIDEAGGEYMLYRCTPIKRVIRGATKVMPFKPKK